MLLEFKILFIVIPFVSCIYEHDMTLKVEPGTKTCLYQAAISHQVLEVQYEVIDGRHGRFDISFSLKDPKGTIMVKDFKKLDNALVYELEQDGDYEFCFDNSHSILNSKLVYFYLALDVDEKRVRAQESDDEIKIETEEGSGEVIEKVEEKGVLEWMGLTEEGEEYYIEISYLADVFTRILKNVGKARHMLEIINAQRSRDMNVMAEDKFTVDAWSTVQIFVMLTVGVIQVIMVKQLFHMHK